MVVGDTGYAVKGRSKKKPDDNKVWINEYVENNGGLFITPYSFEDDWKIMQTNEDQKFHMVSTESIPEERLPGLIANHQSFVGILRRGSSGIFVKYYSNHQLLYFFRS